MNKDDFFTKVQAIMANTPVVIWGSGATVPLGMPTMSALNNELSIEIEEFDGTNRNLEKELSEEKYSNSLTEIRSVIWNTINKSDIDVKYKVIEGNDDYINSIKELLFFLKKPHPELVNIITTNYDRVLENVLGYYNIDFTDGFNGKDLSTFSGSLFSTKKNVNLVKVHGSLNWFNVSKKTRFSGSDLNNLDSKIIIPSNAKYKEAYDPPYRELIQKSDDIISKAKSFLVVGFGFNDEHLTPKVRERVENGMPIIIITKEITDSCNNEISKAREYLLIEEGKENYTKITYKNDSKLINCELEESYWQLNKFMEILT